jgi:hypothetical protein
MLTRSERFYYLHRSHFEKLMHAMVRRKGETAKYWQEETETAFVSRTDAKLTFSFDIASKGGGTTQAELSIGPEDFPTILALMSGTNREATVKAMAEELRHQLCGGKPDYELAERGAQSERARIALEAASARSEEAVVSP